MGVSLITHNEQCRRPVCLVGACVGQVPGGRGVAAQSTRILGSRHVVKRSPDSTCVQVAGVHTLFFMPHCDREMCALV